MEGRERGGSRPGLGKAFPQQLGSGNPVRMLAGVSYVYADNWQYWEDGFVGTTLGSFWSVANWGNFALPAIFEDYLKLVFGGAAKGAVRSAFTAPDYTQAYQLSLFIVPWENAFWGKFQIFAKMNDAIPIVTTDGVTVELALGATGGWTGTATVYNASSPTAYTLTPGTPGFAEPGWLDVLITGTNLKVYWQGTLLLNQTMSLSASAGNRFGFGLNCTDAGGVNLVDIFRCQYKTNTKNQVYRRPLIASANGVLYREPYLGVLEAISSNYGLVSDRQLSATEWGMLLFIADNGNPLTGTDGLRGTGNDKLDSATYTDWTAYSLDNYNYVAVITNPTGGGIAGTYKVTGVAAGELTLDAVWCTTEGDTCTFRIERGPKVYDPATNTLVPWVATIAKGQVPIGNPLIARFCDSLILAGAPVAPHAWFKSKAGDPYDWDFASTDAGAAVAGTSSNAGTIGEPIIALATPSDDYLLFGCVNSIWMMRGDPSYGGRIDCISRNVGIVDKDAWCYGPGGEFIFLSRDGLYMLQPGVSSFPQSISREKLPRELRDLDRAVYTVILKFDARDRGVHIFLTGGDTRGTIHYWFHWSSKSFWPFVIPGTVEPTAALEYQSTNAADSCVLIGGKDGYLRRFRDSCHTDEGTEIESTVLYGPFRPGGSDFYSGAVQELVAALSSFSGDVTWTVLTGDTPEEAVAAAPTRSDVTGTWTAGINFKVRPQVDGVISFIKIENAENVPWTIERLTQVVERMGKQRKF
jgi:hypothetical protein